eukprot:scaffold10313_cov10-Tisochrysis_lutea.AAC.1
MEGVLEGEYDCRDYLHEAKGNPLSGSSSSDPSLSLLNTSEEACNKWVDDWDDYVKENGMASIIRVMLQRSPCEFPGGAHKYTWVLLPFLEFETQGRPPNRLLPDPLPSHRQ